MAGLQELIEVVVGIGEGRPDAWAARPDTWKLPKDIDTPDLNAAAAVLDAC